MSKPTTLPRWNTDASNRVAPTSGHQNTGFTVGEKPTSGNFNWLFFYIYSWLLWIDGLLTSGGGFTALVNQHITVSGTGEFKHGDKELLLHPSALVGTNGAYSTSGYFLSSGAGTATCSMQLKSGDRIKSVTFARYGDGAADITGANVVLTNSSQAAVLGVGVTVTDPPASWADTVIAMTLTAWVATTAYNLNNRVTNAGRYYTCITAGTSAGSGGPTTTAADITDGSAHWKYLGEGTNPTLVTRESQSISFNYSATNIRIGNISIVYDRP